MLLNLLFPAGDSGEEGRSAAGIKEDGLRPADDGKTSPMLKLTVLISVKLPGVQGIASDGVSRGPEPTPAVANQPAEGETAPTVILVTNRALPDLLLVSVPVLGARRYASAAD